MISSDYRFGEKVHSRMVGKKPDFTGVITYCYETGKRDVVYHVRDDVGDYHLRTESDLASI